MSILHQESIVLTCSLLNETGKIITFNDNVANFFGYTPNELKLIEKLGLTFALSNEIGKNHSKFVKKFLDKGSS